MRTPPSEALAVLPVDLGDGVRAGFSTRAGGVSSAPYDSLNLGDHVGDDAELVRTNVRILGRWLGSPITTAAQVHGAAVAEIAAGDTRRREADALVASAPGVGLGVMVADCVPVLLADVGAGVVATAHAGRPGLVAGVVPHVVAAMVARGADVGRIRAALGPSICGRCYEVPAAMRDDVDAAVPGTAATTSWGTPAVDIAAGVQLQLSTAGVRQIHLVRLCTYEDERFYSYRRDGRTGRFAGVVAIAR